MRPIGRSSVAWASAGSSRAGPPGVPGSVPKAAGAGSTFSPIGCRAAIRSSSKEAGISLRAMDKAFYFDKLYPFQDQVLRILREVETGFYLTGGTAASRGYLHHRLSDDLDFFVNDDRRFLLWAERWIQTLTEQPGL